MDSNNDCCQVAVAVVELEVAGLEAFVEEAIESEAERIVVELAVAVAVIEQVLVMAVLGFVAVELAKTNGKEMLNSF